MLLLRCKFLILGISLPRELDIIIGWTKCFSMAFHISCGDHTHTHHHARLVCVCVCVCVCVWCLCVCLCVQWLWELKGIYVYSTNYLCVYYCNYGLGTVTMVLVLS